MRIRVLHHAKKTELAVVELPETATVEDLNQELKKASRFLVNQPAYLNSDKGSSTMGNNTLQRKPFLFGKKIRDHVDAQDFEVTLKDLGPQLPYKTLFVLEYLGPLITLPLGYLISNNRSDTAKFGAILGIVHFLKRELESQYVHIFSNASVPVSGSFKNFIHYWIIYGIFVVGELFFFKTKSSDWPREFYWIFTIIILLLEFLNFKAHCVLRDLRLGSDGKVDPHKRGVPKGWGFDFVHCANYSYEILVWVFYTIMTKSWASAVFALFGAYTMKAWAKKKKNILLETFKGTDDKLEASLKRKALLVPGLL